jgi:hypothetical protein
MICTVRWLSGLAACLVVVACLSACTAPDRSANVLTTQYAPRRAQFAIPELQRAAYFYKSYYALAPGDLVGLKRLAEVCATLEDAGVEDESCQEAAEWTMKDQGGQGEEGVHNSPAAVLWEGWLEEVATAEPHYLIGQELDNGWTCLGYDLVEEPLVRGEPVSLLVYWAGPASANAGSEQNGWYRAGERWVQILERVQNLLSNGGFELGIDGNESPTGFPWDVYRTDPGTRRLVAGVRAKQHTTVAMLDNTEVYSRTSFASTWVPINPDGLYLQAGWMKSIGGNGYLGRRYAGNIADGALHYSYVATSVTADEWQHYAGMTRPLEGATRCQVWLLNHRAVGRVYFDNVLFIEVGQPGK